MADIINSYSKKQQLSEGVYVMEDGNRSWAVRSIITLNCWTLFLHEKLLLWLMSGSGCDCDKEEIENALTILSTSIQNLRNEVNKIDVKPATSQDIDNLF